uniref:Uncharacterized protein n=1 Tax=Otus sunia TaxID=257818 RepID=A0A8C8ASZ0_9STRI
TRRPAPASVRWVFLLPVAGAAAGSRPAYLRGKRWGVRGPLHPRDPSPASQPPPRPQVPTRRAWRG